MRNQVKKAYKPRLEVIEKYVRGRRLLDIGCAAGFFLELASERGWQAEGVDVSEYATEYGKNLGLKIFTGTLIEASFPDQYFDAVTMWDCLMHMPDPYGTMVEINRILKRGVFWPSTPLTLIALTVSFLERGGLLCRNWNIFIIFLYRP
jgi:2-polyprenyl-3-methyl-5-hydroxy-6-metoxy-1,4-benzoquinol methylase